MAITLTYRDNKYSTLLLQVTCPNSSTIEAAKAKNGSTAMRSSQTTVIDLERIQGNSSVTITRLVSKCHKIVKV
jgi:hypothetical protein